MWIAAYLFLFFPFLVFTRRERKEKEKAGRMVHERLGMLRGE